MKPKPLFRVLFLSLFIFGHTACGFRPEKPENKILYEEGVSRELAAVRKKSLSDIVYTLHFTIPEKMSEPVTARMRLRFTLDKTGSGENLVLDFKEDFSRILSLEINGAPSGYTFKNEHILIPSGELKRGANEITADFLAGELSLNRNEDYLYTLLVPDRARTLFPCFDQPDLKASYSLTLTLPEKWEAVSNSAELAPGAGKSAGKPGTRTVSFAPTEPLSTYLFSFVAGNFRKSAHEKDGRRIHIFHRETDPGKIAQLDTIAAQVFASLEWMEDYTGIPYPFSKYDLIILPGFQFGGMEHTGATLYNDSRMFLPPHPTLSQRLSRTELIAHETAHMWFGDLVTMDWFSGVWIKEVFANFFASRIIRPLYPDINYSLNDLNFYTGAYSEDRTPGTVSIQQDLPNLRYAGLIYGQIVYQKSPVVMNMLFDIMGEEAFQKGIREYLNTYQYGNAHWDDLIRIFSKYTPADLYAWNRTWIYEKGMPRIDISVTGEPARKVLVTQTDKYGRDIAWPQPLELTFIRERSGKNAREDSSGKTEIRKAVIYLSGKETFVNTDSLLFTRILPNLNGKFYGYIRLDAGTIGYILENLYSGPVFKDNLTARKSMLIALWENYLNGNLPGERFMTHLQKYLETEKNPQLFPTVLGYITGIAARDSVCRERAEKALYDFTLREPDAGRASQVFKSLPSLASSAALLGRLYEIWETRHPPANIRLSEDDYTGLAYQLAIKLPQKENHIVKTQRARITHPDKLRKFDFISRAVTPDTSLRDALFASLLIAENRSPEPWVQSVLSYLNHPERSRHALKYIRPALEEMEEVQKTGDIFFPKGWIASVLGGHRSPEALRVMNDFLRERPDLPQLLKNKILQSGDHLERAALLNNYY